MNSSKSVKADEKISVSLKSSSQFSSLTLYSESHLLYNTLDKLPPTIKPKYSAIKGIPLFQEAIIPFPDNSVIKLSFYRV